MDQLLVPSAHAKPRQKHQPWLDDKWSPDRSAEPDSFTAALSRQLRSANDLLLSLKDGLSADQRERIRFRDERRGVLCHRLKTADSYQQWQAAARELDALEGHDAWKLDASSDDYMPDLLERRLRALDDARARRDIRSMMHLIRTSLSRDLAGTGNVDLYRNSYVGTKELVERYVDSAIQTIDAVVDLEQGPDSRDLLEAMLFSRQSFGRSAMLLSGGGTFGMTHIGVLKALFEARLLPRIISGSSAGSIVCAVVCTRTDTEIPALIHEFPHGDLAVFEAPDSRLGLLDHLRRLLTEGSWSDIGNLTRVMRGLTGDLTFQEAYNRTRRILNICVSPASIYELPRLLNYITAPNVLIWSAVAASCSVPLFFSSSPLLVKDPVTGDHHPWNPTPQRFIDGSVDNDLPMTRLAEMFNVNHFIVSQVNPHVVPFLSNDDHLWPGAEPIRSRQRGADLDWATALGSLAKEEALHRMQFMADMGVLPNLMTKCRSVLSQKYSGDITILPEISVHDLPRLMSNPTPEFMLRASALGERATWPKLSRIRDRCAIELALDGAVHRLRARVVFSQSQRDLRGLGSGAATLQPPVQLFVSGQPVPPDSLDAGEVARRQRRRSGGSVQIPSHSHAMMGLGTTDDDETADEERSHGVLRKPQLKRASRSQVQVPVSRTSLLAPAHQGELPRTLGFGLCRRPVTPPARRGAQHGAPDESKPAAWVQHAESPRGTATSPTDDNETSELEQSSDADAEPGTDESELDPFEGQFRCAGASKHQA